VGKRAGRRICEEREKRMAYFMKRGEGEGITSIERKGFPRGGGVE